MMRHGIDTTQRAMHPPILFVWCPEGHWWPLLNVRWYTDQKRTRLDDRWCPDHEAERERHRRKELQRVAREREAAYAKLPPPTSRRCVNPNPLSHPQGAVLPSGSFYRRTLKSGAETLDSRCKQCRREEQKGYRDAWSPEKRKQRMQAKVATDRERRRNGRRALANETDKRLDAGPFSEWLVEFKEGREITIQEIADAAHVDEALIRRCVEGERNGVMLSTVDKVGIGWGFPDLVTTLYPVEA